MTDSKSEMEKTPFVVSSNKDDSCSESGSESVPMVVSCQKDEDFDKAAGYSLTPRRVSLHDKHPMVVNQKK